MSLILFGIGLITKFKKQFLISSFLITLFGISFLCGAIIPMGSPWHSLYGLTISIMLLLFAFLYEMDTINISKLTKRVAIIVTVIIFFYFWSILLGFDPSEKRGLTQRIFGVTFFGWFSYTAYILNNLKTENKTSPS